MQMMRVLPKSIIRRRGTSMADAYHHHHHHQPILHTPQQPYRFQCQYTTTATDSMASLSTSTSLSQSLQSLRSASLEAAATEAKSSSTTTTISHNTQTQTIPTNARKVIQSRALQCSFSSVFHLRKAGMKSEDANEIENIFLCAIGVPVCIFGVGCGVQYLIF